MFLMIFVLLLLCESSTASREEPVCSAFDFEIKTLETMLRTEHRVEKLMDDNRAKHDSMAEELKQFKLEMTTEFDKLKSKMEKNLLEETEKLELSKTHVENRLQSVDNALALVKNTLYDITVAFSVNVPTGSFVNGVPTFKITIINTGDGYNMDTGVFTAPVDGLYLFVFTVTSGGKHNVYCWIRHNKGYKAIGRTSIYDSYTTAAASVYLMLTKGDTVSLGGCIGWSNVNLGTSTSFNGALIKQTKMN